MAQGDGTHVFDTSWTLNPAGCITVDVSGINFSVTFDSCNFSGFIIDGSSYSFSGQVTINGEQFDIEEFAGELP